MAKTIKIKVETVELTFVYRENDTGKIHTGTYPWTIAEESFENACETIAAMVSYDCTIKKIFKGEKTVANYEIPIGTVITHLTMANLDFSKYRVE